MASRWCCRRRWQINQLKKEFMPEGVVFGHNTLYFDHPQPQALQKTFVVDYMDRYKGGAALGGGPGIFRTRHLQGGVTRRKRRRAMADAGAGGASYPGLEVESLAARRRFRTDKIAEQVFYQGPSTNTNNNDFPDAGVDRHLPGRTVCRSRRARISGVDQEREDAGLTAMTDLWTSSCGDVPRRVLFLVAAGLQLVFGVQKIVNLACRILLCPGRVFRNHRVGLAIKLGMPPLLFFPVLIPAGLAIGLVGLPIGRVLRTIYRRDESFSC